MSASGHAADNWKMGIPSIFEQAIKAAASAAMARAEQEKPAWPLNPFQPGVRSGSTSDRVLAELRRVSPVPLEHGQLRVRCAASHGAVSWALRYLESVGLVARVSDPRHPQYRRWRAK